MHHVIDKSSGVPRSPPIQAKVGLDDQHGSGHWSIHVSDVQNHAPSEGSGQGRTLTFTGPPPFLNQSLPPNLLKGINPVVGCCSVKIDYGHAVQMPLLIVACSEPTLLGRGWLSQIADWTGSRSITCSLHLCKQWWLGTQLSSRKVWVVPLKSFKAEVHVDPHAQIQPSSTCALMPFKARWIRSSIIFKTSELWSWWTALILAVLKQDKLTVCICGDFSPVLRLDKYPIPKINDLFTKLGKGKYILKLELLPATPSER